MKRDSDPGLGGAAGGASHPVQRWLLAGGDAPGLEQLALMLARFGVDAQPFGGDPQGVRHRAVLCDARDRAVVRLWIDDIALRTAPLICFGAGTCGIRARLIDAGASDAVSARIGMPELAARLKAADRLHQAMRGKIRLCGFTFDTGLRQVRWRDMAVSLMPREFDLLLVLARHMGSSISRDELLRAVWRTSFDPGTNSVEVHVCKLRRALAALDGEVWIETVRHGGYRLVSKAFSGG